MATFIRLLVKYDTRSIVIYLIIIKENLGNVEKIKFKDKTKLLYKLSSKTSIKYYNIQKSFVFLMYLIII